jgi:hypothetical protein
LSQPRVLEQPQHTIRGYQGHKQKADNRFDRWDPNDPTLADYWDFNVSTTFTPILYSHRDPVSPASIGYVPWSVPNDPLRFQGLPFDDDFGGCGVLLPLIPYDPGDNGSGMAEDQEEYGTLKYLYDQMMDGGSTDEVVQEIVSSWPSEAWQLRQYLLDLSPFLSMESLKQAVNKPNFPMAMKAEVCIANPDATQKEGFIKWLELEANEPMPAYLIAMIEASWETKTFRTDMEMELADLHTAICQRATEMLLRGASETGAIGCPVAVDLAASAHHGGPLCRSQRAARTGQFRGSANCDPGHAGGQGLESP